MKQIVLAGAFLALLALWTATLDQPLGLCFPQPGYADQSQPYPDAWYRYPRGVYPRLSMKPYLLTRAWAARELIRPREANYEFARARYDANYGQGAFFRYYRAHPAEYERIYGAAAYDGDFGARRF